ncbi:hypothetical protein [Brevibacillus sp. SIMBA_040]|uniref:hypothetical protein n=1 Tax=unclassified Brevibacillus TaxID=2684853 RepID=UPI00397946E8
MVAVLGIVIVAFLVIMIEVPSLMKKRQRKELWIFSFLLVLGVGISIAHSMHVMLPNPIDWIIQLYRPASEMLDNALK